jgi:hypothetical protein
MPNQEKIYELLKFNPGEFTDPVPDWWLRVLDKNILRELVLVSLERTKAIQEINLRTIESAANIIRKAKL